MTIPKFLSTYYPIIFLWLLGITVLFSFRKRWPLPFKMLALFVLFYVLVDTTGNIMAAFYKTNNHFLYNILFNIQFMVVAYFYHYFIRSESARRMIQFFLILFPVFVIANSLFFQRFYTWQAYSFVLGAGFMITLAVAYIWQLYTSEETHSIFTDPIFWFSLSWLFYFLVTLPYFGMLNYLLEKYPVFTLKYYLIVIDLSDCIHNLLLTIGFLCVKVRVR